MGATMTEETYRRATPAQRRAIGLIGRYLEYVRLQEVVGVSQNMADELVRLGYAESGIVQHYDGVHYRLTELGQLVDSWNKGYRIPQLPS